jgi:hypothetical protein
VKAKQPHPFIGTTAIDCDYCRGTGKAPSLGLIASVIDLCHHCNGLGEVDSEHGPYHVDIVIQQYQERTSKSQSLISKLRENIHYKDPRCEMNYTGRHGACKSE